MQINSSNSKVEFTIKKLLLLTVKGILPEIKGDAEFNENNLSDSKLELTIPVSNVDTKNSKRDKHLLNEDFFHADKFPNITFTSTEISKNNGIYSAKGELNICGKINTIEIPFQFTNNQAIGEFSFNRKDYSFGKIPTFVAANKVSISFVCSL